VEKETSWWRCPTLFKGLNGWKPSQVKIVEAQDQGGALSKVLSELEGLSSCWQPTDLPEGPYETRELACIGSK